MALKFDFEKIRWSKSYRACLTRLTRLYRRRHLLLVTINPTFMSKIKKLKAGYKLLQSSSEDDSEDTNVDIDMNSFDAHLQNVPFILRAKATYLLSEEFPSLIKVQRRHHHTEPLPLLAQSSKSSTSSTVPGSPAKPKISTTEPYVVDLDPPSPINESYASIASNERLLALSAMKDKFIVSERKENFRNLELEVAHGGCSNLYSSFFIQETTKEIGCSAF
ncbi:hypothetical protein EDC94DRAFT_644239 [Helicostylum pulchrum]|nr:hypothetical protein EDC94DRAFT_644239 [Helicostylum pulchrum]